MAYCVLLCSGIRSIMSSGCRNASEKRARAVHIGFRAADGAWYSAREISGEQITGRRTIRNPMIELSEDIFSGRSRAADECPPSRDGFVFPGSGKVPLSSSSKPGRERYGQRRSSPHQCGLLRIMPLSVPLKDRWLEVGKSLIVLTVVPFVIVTTGFCQDLWATAAAFKGAALAREVASCDNLVR